MKYDFIVLGADGNQGSIVVRYLLERGYRVLATDIFKLRIGSLLQKYKKQADFHLVDVTDSDKLIGAIQTSNPDVVINCAEGDWNMNVYRACISTQRHVVDLGSRLDMTGDQLKLNREFKKIGCTAITGCGSVPGIGNVMLAHAAKKFDSIESINVGFAWDSNLKRFVVPFSIESVLEEYTLRSPYIQGGRMRRMRPADSAIIKNFRVVGSQKIFLVDHPETYTFFHYFKPMGVQNIRFYAGFPRHSEQVISALLDLTFSDTDHVSYQEKNIVPGQFLSQMLKRMKPPRGYKEWENLWVEVVGRTNRKKKTILMECIVPPLKGWEEAGCNIDTGFPAAIIAEMIKYGDIS
ncbi:saccharopine dehydrogenase NADP-binding domain-containing protein [Candidatus Uhrbacteria bacterium]|nr:saccharopine dehydrogenase NADP-binding domain-containing protein [Candidatus Uhrbacteria bacterium]